MRNSRNLIGAFVLAVSGFTLPASALGVDPSSAHLPQTPVNPADACQHAGGVWVTPNGSTPYCEFSSSAGGSTSQDGWIGQVETSGSAAEAVERAKIISLYTTARQSDVQVSASAARTEVASAIALADRALTRWNASAAKEAPSKAPAALKRIAARNEAIAVWTKTRAYLVTLEEALQKRIASEAAKKK